MKNTTKRILSMLLALVLSFGALSGAILPAEAATVNYAYDGKYVYNWGERDETATFLSPMAEEFYQDNNVTYQDLVSLSGSSTTNVTSSDLYGELQDLMSSNHSNKTSYDETRPLYKYTDCQNGGGKISSFYSGTLIGPGWDGGDTWNREHTWPQSKSPSGDGKNDIIMLRPTAKSENSSRGNTAYGEGSGYYDPNKLGQNVRGDVARIMLYQHVRWGNSSLWGQSGVMESKSVLLKWMEEDPVDTWELGRNDAVQAITGTRNVFVDYPELAFQLFNEAVPANYATPSGSDTGVNYNITATSADPARGTVSVSGRTITATPAAGYEASGYTILSGTATVTQNGNRFIVNPTSDVTVQITFTEKIPMPTVSELVTGDQVVIFAPAYNKALSSQIVANYYLAGVDISEESGALVGYASTETWTVTKNSDDTYSFANGGQTLGMADTNNSMRPGEINDKWQMIGLGGSLYNVRNTVRGTYMEWYAEKQNWSTYTTASDGQFQLSFYVIGKGLLTGEGTAPEQPPVNPDQPPVQPEQPSIVGPAAKLNALPVSGDVIAIYTSGKVLGSTPAGSKLAGVNGTVTGNVLSLTQDMAQLTVGVEGDKFTFSMGGKYLTSGATGGALSFETALTDCARWTMTSAGNGAWYITNVGAVYKEQNNQALEFFNSNFTTYGKQETEAFQMQLFKVGEGTVPNPEQPPVNPDQPPVNPDQPITPPATNDGILELTVDALGIALKNYYTGTATVEGIAFDLTQIGNYGNGIQMRDREDEGKTSILFNTTALPGKITKIELTSNANKTVYDNADAVIFSFGAAQDSLTYTTKLSTVADQTSYTITPSGDFTFFRIEHDLGYTLYWDSIKVYYETAEPEPPAPIAKLTAPKVEKNGETLSWAAVANADSYEIYRATSKSGKYTKVTTVTETFWTDSADAKTYYYKVKAIYTADSSKNSGFSSVVSVVFKCDAPQITVVNDSKGKPKLSWEKVSGAKKYTVYRATSETGKYSKLGTTTKTYYTDSKAKAGTTYFYKVIANASKSTYNSPYSSIVSCNVICGTPSVTVKIDSATGKPSLSWKKIDGAAKYRILRQLPGEETFTVLAEQTGVTFADKTAPIDTLCVYMVQALGKTESLNGKLSKEVSATSGIAKPVVKGSINKVTGKPTLTWEAVEGAVKYEIYRSTKSSKSYKLLTTVEELSYEDATVSAGKTYYYKVKAIGEVSKSADSSYVKLTGKCATPEISVTVNEKSGKPVLSWEKISGAKKYTVYRATSETGKYSKLGTTTKLSYTDSKAKAGTTYFYKIVANASSSTYNSAYSNVVSCGAYCAQTVATIKLNNAGQPVVSWKKVDGAVKYIVLYVAENGTEDDVQQVETTKTSFTLKDGEVGTGYVFMVMAVPKNEEYSNSGNVVAAYVTLPQPTMKSIKLVSGKPQITWSASEDADCVIVFRSTKKSSGYEAITMVEGGNTFIDTSAKKGKTYYYKVAAVAGDSLSPLSGYKSIKSK